MHFGPDVKSPVWHAWYVHVCKIRVPGIESLHGAPVKEDVAVKQTHLHYRHMTGAVGIRRASCSSRLSALGDSIVLCTDIGLGLGNDGKIFKSGKSLGDKKWKCGGLATIKETGQIKN